MGTTRLEKAIQARSAAVVDPCSTGKKVYMSRSHAKDSLKRLRGEGKAKGLTEFCCATCKFWHLGHGDMEEKAFHRRLRNGGE